MYAQALGDALAQRLKSLRVLCLRGVHFGHDLEAVLSGVARSQLAELNMEDTAYGNDVGLADTVTSCESLRALVISNNQFLEGANSTCAAVVQSRVERLEARKMGTKMTREALKQLASAPRLLFLDLRGTELSRDDLSEFLHQMQRSTHLYSLKLSRVPLALMFAMLRENSTLGILCPAEPQDVTPFNLSDEGLLGDNCSLFVMDPLPQSCQREIGARIKSNYEVARRVRGLILLILAAHKFHRHENDFGVFPKDIIVLLMKIVWGTRRDRAWSALRGEH